MCYSRFYSALPASSLCPQIPGQLIAAPRLQDFIGVLALTERWPMKILERQHPGAALLVLWKPCPATQQSWGHLPSVRATGIQATWMEREVNLSELKSYELLWMNLSSGKTEFGHFWPRCLYSSDCRHWYLTESGLELQLSGGSDSLGDCGIQRRKIPNGCKAVSLGKWDFTLSGSDWLIPPQISVILLWSVSKFALFFNHYGF